MCQIFHTRPFNALLLCALLRDLWLFPSQELDATPMQDHNTSVKVPDEKQNALQRSFIAGRPTCILVRQCSLTRDK